MELKTQQIIIYFLTFCIPLLLQWLKLQQSKKEGQDIDWKQVFSSSIEIIIASIGFIYALVEKDSKFQFLYWLVIVLLIVGLIFERFSGEKRWAYNMALMIFTIAIPSYFLFLQSDKKTDGLPKTNILSDKDKEYLEKPSTNTTTLRKICADYLSGKGNMNEGDFSKSIQECSNIEEKNLFMACLLKQKDKMFEAEEYLNEVKSEKFKTDKDYIIYSLFSNQADKIGNLVINENSSWLGIDKLKLSEAKRIVSNSYKSAINILILDASAGRGRNTTSAGENWKAKFKDFKNINVMPLDYSQVPTNIKIHTTGYYTKSIEKKGLKELANELRKSGLTNFGEPGSYVSNLANTYDMVIVVNR